MATQGKVLDPIPEQEVALSRARPARREGPDGVAVMKAIDRPRATR